MSEQPLTRTTNRSAAGCTPRAGARHRWCWAFVYVFFSNGTPFDAPNRSETCPRLAV